MSSVLLPVWRQCLCRRIDGLATGLLQSNVYYGTEARLNSIEFLYLKVSIEDGPVLRLAANAAF